MSTNVISVFETKYLIIFVKSPVSNNLHGKHGYISVHPENYRHLQAKLVKLWAFLWTGMVPFGNMRTDFGKSDDNIELNYGRYRELKNCHYKTAFLEQIKANATGFTSVSERSISI